MNKFLEFIIELSGWIRIILSPSILGVIAGYWVYATYPDEKGMFWGIVIAATGFVIGVVWATLVWIKKGTNNFLSTAMASPDVKDINVKSKQNTEK